MRYAMYNMEYLYRGDKSWSGGANLPPPSCAYGPGSCYARYHGLPTALDAIRSERNTLLRWPARARTSLVRLDNRCSGSLPAEIRYELAWRSPITFSRNTLEGLPVHRIPLTALNRNYLFIYFFFFDRFHS
jgi:hypothetical protein